MKLENLISGTIVEIDDEHILVKHNGRHYLIKIGCGYIYLVKSEGEIVKNGKIR